MTLEEKLQKIIGAQVLAIASLEVQLDQAKARIAELEKSKPNEPKAE